LEIRKRESEGLFPLGEREHFSLEFHISLGNKIAGIFIREFEGR